MSFILVILILLVGITAGLFIQWKNPSVCPKLFSAVSLIITKIKALINKKKDAEKKEVDS